MAGGSVGKKKVLASDGSPALQLVADLVGASSNEDKKEVEKEKPCEKGDSPRELPEGGGAPDL
eukprot:8235898-Lingulodinium_polyedra.AAC.1